MQTKITQLDKQDHGEAESQREESPTTPKHPYMTTRYFYPTDRVSDREREFKELKQRVEVERECRRAKEREAARNGERPAGFCVTCADEGLNFTDAGAVPCADCSGPHAQRVRDEERRRIDEA